MPILESSTPLRGQLPHLRRHVTPNPVILKPREGSIWRWPAHRLRNLFRSLAPKTCTGPGRQAVHKPRQMTEKARDVGQNTGRGQGRWNPRPTPCSLPAKNRWRRRQDPAIASGE